MDGVGADGRRVQRVRGTRRRGVPAHGYGSLALNEIGPELEAANTRLAEFINRERAYDETPAVAKADRQPRRERHQETGQRTGEC